MMHGEDRVAQEGRKARHKRIAETAEVCAIAHFFCKNVRGIDLSSDMFHLESLILHPFSNGVVAEFDMAGSLRCHVVRQFDARLIVVVKDCGSIVVWDGIT